MKAIFHGSISGGFSICSLEHDLDAPKAVAEHLASGVMAEAVTVEDPSTLDKSAVAGQNGLEFVVYGKSLGGGFQVYGPFGDHDDAETFAEDNRSQDDEWEIFTSPEAYQEKSYPSEH